MHVLTIALKVKNTKGVSALAVHQHDRMADWEL